MAPAVELARYLSLGSLPAFFGESCQIVDYSYSIDKSIHSFNVDVLPVVDDELVAPCELWIASQQMSWLGRLLAGDEELGKKDDDHRPLNGTASSSWSPRQPASPWRRRRIFYGVWALLLLYVFVQNIPTDLGPATRYAPSAPDNRGGKLPSDPKAPPSKKPKRPATPSEAEEHYHDGPIKFYKLAASLHGVARLDGQHALNKNVLFAASNLKSASEIIPLACEMARWKRNNVHFAIMGRDEMDMAEIKTLNGAAEEDCDVHWHGKNGSDF